VLCKFIPIFPYIILISQIIRNILKSQESIQKLIRLLTASAKEDYNAILKHYDFSSIDFEPYESWSQKRYTRNCIHRDVAFEIILLCWSQGQETAIHGHDGEDCWVYLLEGEMKEVKYANGRSLNEVSSQKFLPNELSFMNDRLGFHKLQNTNEGKSISLHLYAKPIENCVSFDEVSQQFIKRKLSYDTFKQLAFKH